jgi:hypothetical protein
VQQLQLRARFDAQLIDESAARLAIDRERVGLTAAAVEREHELADRPLAGRFGSHQIGQLGDNPTVQAQLKLVIDPLLDRPQPLLHQPTAQESTDLVAERAREHRPPP